MNKFLFNLFFVFITVACSSAKPTYEYMPDMMDSPAVKAQKEPMRSPVAGTLPRGYVPYPYGVSEGDLAGQQLKNPLSISRETLTYGKDRFNTYCMVCHGSDGKGQGSIVPKFPMPPSLHSEKVRGWTDGRIFHVITQGQNLMSSYAAQIKPEERWALILYIRALQRAAAPKDSDIEAYKEYLQSN